MNYLKRYILPVLFIAGALSSCDKKYDDHNTIDNPQLNTTLLEQIKVTPELSKFAEYLVKTGYDTVLTSTKSYTVFAPNNAALTALDPTVINTADKLKTFVANHIVSQLFLTTSLNQPFLRVKSLNGKNVTYTTASVDGSAYVSKDLYVQNGVLNVIGAAITPKISAWEYLQSTTGLQKTELNSLTYSFFDPTRAEVTGINPKTGLPVYKVGSGIVSTNRFLDRVYGVKKPNTISNEDSTFTYIVLTDAAFLAEQNKLAKYYTLSTKDSTDSLTKFNVIKDLSFRGLLDKDNFPATAFSEGDSVKFHLNKNDVVQTIPVSNGIVYVMSAINYDLTNATFDPYTKLKPILMEAETNTVTYLSAKTVTKPIKRNPDGTNYTQLRVNDPATLSYWARFPLPIVNSMTYRVSWRVVRDDGVPTGKASAGGTAAEPVWFPQRITFGAVATVVFPYVAKPGLVPLKVNNVQQIDADGKNIFVPDYDETVLGTYTATRYYSATTNTKSGAAGALPLFLVSNSTVTTKGLDDILLDYVRMIPVP